MADTSVWVDHFRTGDGDLTRELKRNQIAIHPFIVVELSLGHLPNRLATLAALDRLPVVKLAHTVEVRAMIEAHSLFQRGIGFVDAHLIASVLLSPRTVLWSRDRRLARIAQDLGIQSLLP